TAQPKLQAKPADKTTEDFSPEVLDIVFSLDGTLVFAVGHHWIRVFNAKTGEPAPGFEPIAGAICPHVALSPDGQFLAHSEIHSNSVLVWHLPSRQVGQYVRLPAREGTITRLAFGPTVRQLYIAQTRHLSAWNGETGQCFLDFATEDAQSLAVIEQG